MFKHRSTFVPLFESKINSNLSQLGICLSALYTVCLLHYLLFKHTPGCYYHESQTINPDKTAPKGLVCFWYILLSVTEVYQQMIKQTTVFMKRVKSDKPLVD